MPTERGTQSFDAFVASNARVMEAVIGDYQRRYGSIRVHARVDAIFTREVEERQQRVAAYFTTGVHDVDPTQQFDLQRVADDLSAQADHWNARDSGFIFDRITKFVLCKPNIVPYMAVVTFPHPSGWRKKMYC